MEIEPPTWAFVVWPSGFSAVRRATLPKALTEDTDIPNPREHMAITRIQESHPAVESDRREVACTSRM